VCVMIILKLLFWNYFCIGILNRVNEIVCQWVKETVQYILMSNTTSYGLETVALRVSTLVLIENC